MPLPASASLTSADLEAVQAIVSASDKEQDLKFKEIQLKFQEQNAMFLSIPSLTTVISAAVTTYVATENNKRLEGLIGQFINERDNIKKDLQAGSRANAALGAIAGMVVAVVLMISGSFHHQS